MKLAEFKGEEAFKKIGKVVSCLRKMFEDKRLAMIAKAQNEGWILAFFEISLAEHSDLWVKLYLELNPDETEEDISLQSVIHFAYEFMNDKELNSLFFSSSEQTAMTSSGSPMENTEATETT